jgi:hypothetical protein
VWHNEGVRRIKDFFERGTALPVVIGASAFFGFLTVVGLAVFPQVLSQVAEMRITPSQKAVLVGDEFSVDIVVFSAQPVNVFAGELIFDNTTIEVASIDYNTSIADLWAERPWFSNGDGTLNFAGGTTKPGGFFGTDSLLTVRFRTLKEGSGFLALRNVHILQHDGLGTEAEVATPIDHIITVENPRLIQENLVREVSRGTTFAVVSALPSTDLNGDGKQSIADISIFMMNIGSSDPRFDFNGDGKVNLVDLNILLGTL